MNIVPSISAIIEQEKVDQIIDLIDSSNRIVITSHLSPDGDAIGSTLALYHFIKKRGKNPTMILPNRYPYFLKWMKGINEIKIFEYNPAAGSNILLHADLIFSLDYNVSKRVGDMGEHLNKSSAKKVLIDHHLSPQQNFDIIVSKPHIASTSELLFRLIYQAGEYKNMSEAEAESIYCGMMTDTGGFTYNSNNPEIFEIISLLIRKGIDTNSIYSNVFNNYSEERFRLLGFTLFQRMEICPEFHSALIFLSKKDFEEFNLNKGDTEGFVNYPLNIKSIVFSAFIREDEGLIKISLRSHKSFPCNTFAAQFFNGGGHLNASGGEFQGSLEDAIKLFWEGVKQYEERLKNAAEEL